MKKSSILPILLVLSLSAVGCNSKTSSSFNDESSSSSSSSEASSLPTMYTVTWKNYDGTVLEVDNDVIEGTLPVFDGNTPSKAEDAQYNYVFAGWDNQVVEATSNAIYTATFNNELRSYTVVWKDEDGTVLETDNNVPYGTLPEFNNEEPTKEMTVESTFAFSGWDNDVTEVVGNTVYTATYEASPRKYNVTWKAEDGSVIKAEEVAYGETPVFDGDEPTKDSTVTNQYIFDGWSPNLAAVTGDIEYSPVFKEEVRHYTIRWVNYDGTVLETDDQMEYGQTPVYNGQTPTRESKRGVNFSFKGWVEDIVPVERDAVYTANYDYTASFSYDLIDYQMKSGYSKSDIKGYPWMNSNLQNQLNKIEQPSLKDDFYASINYDYILGHVKGPFEIDDQVTAEAFEALNSGNVSGTTNGDFMIEFASRVSDGDATNISNYLNNLDLDDYLSSKESFVSPSSFLGLSSSNLTSYEVFYKDGYVFGDKSLSTLWYLIEKKGYGYYYSNATNSVISTLNNTLGLSLSSSDISDAKTMDVGLADIVSTKYQKTIYSVASSYNVEDLPWEPMKEALLDLGISATTKIKIKKYNQDIFNYLYNDYAINNVDTLKADLKLRLAFDYRFLLGANTYKGIANSLGGLNLFSADDTLKSTSTSNLPLKMMEAVTHYAYEQSYFELTTGIEVRDQVADLIADILDGYKEMMDEITWLSAETKANIKRKISKMRYCACFEDKSAKLPEIDKTNLGSISFSELFNRYNEAIVKMAINHVPDNQFDWAWEVMPTTESNAFYYPTNNTFIILNGIVPGFLGTCVEEFYGMLGFVIGHEITHAFDSSGSHYDENGQYNDLMKNGDRNTFNNRVNKMVSFYNKINLWGNNFVRGNNVDGEATADMGGIKVMLQLAKKIENFDYDKFFRAAAYAWCTQPYSDSAAQSRLSDEHPFAYLRVNVTLAQFDEFVETYNIEPGDGMFIPEEERVKIW